MEKDRAVACPQRRCDLSKVVSIKVKLRTIRLNESGEAVPDYDLRADFERLTAERVPSASSRAQSPGASLLSGQQPVVEVEAPAGSPMSDLHELATS